MTEVERGSRKIKTICGSEMKFRRPIRINRGSLKNYVGEGVAKRNEE